MPVRERRRRAVRVEEQQDGRGVPECMYAAGNDPAKWAANRGSVIRLWSAHMKPSVAAQVYDAYARAAMRLSGGLLPARAPTKPLHRGKAA